MLEINGTLIILAISFIIFTIIMQWIFYSPITKVRTERKEYIDNNKNDAQSAVFKAQELDTERKNRLSEARKLSSETVSDLTQKANVKKSQLLAEARQKANDELDINKKRILTEKEQAKDQLKQEVVHLAQAISSKILGKEVPISGVTPEMVENLIKK